MGSVPESENDRADATMALQVMAAFQSYLQHADMKVSTLVVVHAGAAVAMMTASAVLTTRHGVITMVLLGCFVLAFLMSGHHLIQALRPRLGRPLPGPPRRDSAFGIIGIPLRPPTTASQQRDEAWAMARTFADIALIKHDHVGRAIPWTAAMLVTGLCGVMAGLLSG